MGKPRVPRALLRMLRLFSMPPISFKLCARLIIPLSFSLLSLLCAPLLWKLPPIFALAVFGLSEGK